MKRLIAIIFIICTSVSFAQIPPGYYDSAAGLQGSALKTALFNIIKNPNVDSYSELWSDFYSTDKDNYYEHDGTVLDIYSENPNGTDPYNFTLGSDQCGTYSTEGDCYNREHSFPKSWFNNATPMYSDLFHLYPTDGKVNGQRSNYPYGEVSNPSWTSLNGSKLGPCSYPGYTGTVFEPIDEFKGDLARTYFYMATCYEDRIETWSSVVLNGTSYPCYTSWFINMLLQWNTQDPVSQKEIDRNNAVYNIQGNRNPYIDHPEWVNCIWANNCSSDISAPTITYLKISPNPVKNIVSVSSSEKINTCYIINTTGQIVYSKNNISDNKTRINLSFLKAGFYFITVRDEKGNNTVSKIIKN